MNDTGVIDQFLTVFTQYIDSGFGLLGGEVGFLSTTLIVIDVTIAALFWAWGTDEDVLQRLIKKTLYIGTFAFIIGNFSNLAGIMLQSFAGLGLQASGSGMAIGVGVSVAGVRRSLSREGRLRPGLRAAPRQRGRPRPTLRPGRARRRKPGSPRRARRPPR